jgi:hypothetical protein
VIVGASVRRQRWGCRGERISGGQVEVAVVAAHPLGHQRYSRAAKHGGGPDLTGAVAAVATVVRSRSSRFAGANLQASGSTSSPATVC